MSKSFSQAFKGLGESFGAAAVAVSQCATSIERVKQVAQHIGRQLDEPGGDTVATIDNEQLAAELIDYSSIVTDNPQLAAVTISGTSGNWMTTEQYQWIHTTDNTAPIEQEEWPPSPIIVNPSVVTVTTPPWVWTQANFTHSQGDANMREVELLGELSKITGLDFRSMLTLFTQVGGITKIQREKAIEQYSHAINQFAVDGQFNVWERAYAVLLVKGRNSGYFLFGKDVKPTNYLEFEIHKLNKPISTVRKIRIGPFIPEDRETIEFLRTKPIVCPDSEYTIHVYYTDEDLYVREGNFYRKKEE